MTKPWWIACLMLSLALASCAILAPSTPAVQSTATRAGPTPLASPSAAATATSEPAPVPTNTPISDATEAPATEAPASATPAASPTPLTAFMTFQDFQIVPGTLTIQVGTTVVFLIEGGFGSVHQPYSSFPNNTDLSGLFEAPPRLGDGASYSFTFTQTGTFTVRCGYHPDEMVATIEVTP